MPQGSLPLPYEVEKSEIGFTSLAGLFLYLDLMDRLGFRESLNRQVRARAVRSQGFCDYEVVSSLVLLNLAGDDREDDFESRMKAIRFHVIRLAGRVVQHARRLIVHLARTHPSTGWLLAARDRIAGLSPLPVGQAGRSGKKPGNGRRLGSIRETCAQKTGAAPFTRVQIETLLNLVRKSRPEAAFRTD